MSIELSRVVEEEEWYQMVDEINRCHAMCRGMVPSHFRESEEMDTRLPSHSRENEETDARPQVEGLPPARQKLNGGVNSP